MRMKNFLTVFVLFFVASASTLFMVGCRKNVGPAELSPTPIPKVPVHQIIVAAFDAKENDSLAGFNVKVVSPTGTNDYVMTGKKYTINDVKTGKYIITVSKSGYVETTKDYDINLPDMTLDFSMLTRLYITKASTPVAVAMTGGATTTAMAINVSTDGNNTPGATTKPAEAKMTLPAGTEIRLADGSIPTSLAIVATPVISEAASAVDNGSNTGPITAPSEDALLNGLGKSMNFQPSGLTLSKPLKIAMYVGDILEKGTQFASINAQKKKGLVFVNVAKDGTKETIKPMTGMEHIADTVYFEINHFSTWDMLPDYMVKTRMDDLNVPEYFNYGSKQSDCGKPLGLINSLTGFLDAYEVVEDEVFNNVVNNYIIFGFAKAFALKTKIIMKSEPVTGYKVVSVPKVRKERWKFTNKPTYNVLPANGIELSFLTEEVTVGYNTIKCHNVGGGK